MHEQSGNLVLSPSPLSTKYHTGIWAAPSPRHAIQAAAVKLVPKSASVTATYSLDPHLTHRTRVYEWPNPFRLSYWGVNGENQARPSSIEWLVIDRQTVGGGDVALLNRLLATSYRTVFDQSDIVVARRIH